MYSVLDYRYTLTLYSHHRHHSSKCLHIIRKSPSHISLDFYPLVPACHQHTCRVLQRKWNWVEAHTSGRFVDKPFGQQFNSSITSAHAISMPSLKQIFMDMFTGFYSEFCSSDRPRVFQAVQNAFSSRLGRTCLLRLQSV
jgi:hypothetical protein